MKTSKIHVLLLPLLLLSAACGPAHIGDGHKVSEVRQASGFTRVENASSLDVVIHRGAAEHVEVLVDENLQRHVRIYTSGETLVVENRAWLSWDGLARVDVSLPVLEGALLSGSGNVSADGTQEAVDVSLEVTGSGDLEICDGMKSVSLRLSGSGDLVACAEAAGVQGMTARSSGSGDLVWDGEVATGVDAMLSGSGDVTLGGAAQVLEGTVSGSGTLNARALAVTQATLSNSGSGNLRATVNDGVAEIRISGSGDVELWGTGTADVRDDSGSGDLIRH